MKHAPNDAILEQIGRENMTEILLICANSLYKNTVIYALLAHLSIVSSLWQDIICSVRISYN